MHSTAIEIHMAWEKCNSQLFAAKGLICSEHSFLVAGLEPAKQSDFGMIPMMAQLKDRFECNFRKGMSGVAFRDLSGRSAFGDPQERIKDRLPPVTPSRVLC
jgi:hypothetical protein